MRTTVDWSGVCQVTLLTYYSAKEAIAYTDTREFFEVEELSSHRYVFAAMEGSVEDVTFPENYVESGEEILLREYWSGRNGNISNNWKLFQTLPLTLVNSFWKIYRSTRQELPKGNTALEETPDFDKEPDTEQEKKSAKSGKKAT